MFMFNIFIINKKFLDYLMNKTLYIQIWGEQKHTAPNQSMASKPT